MFHYSEIHPFDWSNNKGICQYIKGFNSPIPRPLSEAVQRNTLGT
nr:MAG TPA: hypothetical protein [Caudoviricetes sp.]